MDDDWFETQIEEEKEELELLSRTLYQLLPLSSPLETQVYVEEGDEEGSHSTPIYLDYNATTPLALSVSRSILSLSLSSSLTPFTYGNPSSSHPLFGAKMKGVVEEARKQVAKLVCGPLAGPSNITFTSGGTESNNMLIKGYVLKHKKNGNHIITSTVEHPAVIDVCQYLQTIGFEVSYVPVDNKGYLDPEVVRDAIRPETILVSLMHANNETGNVFPLAKIAKVIREEEQEIGHEICFHTDASQSVGKIPTFAPELGVDAMTVAGHKLYAPKGIGALYTRNSLELEPLFQGGGQEKGKRPGTENVILCCALGAACELAAEELEDRAMHLKKTRDALFDELSSSLPADSFYVNTHFPFALPNTLSLCFQHVCSGDILKHIENEVVVSGGSSCHSTSVKPSAVLLAMGVDEKLAKGALRISTGRGTTMNDVKEAASVISKGYLCALEENE